MKVIYVGHALKLTSTQ